MIRYDMFPQEGFDTRAYCSRNMSADTSNICEKGAGQSRAASAQMTQLFLSIEVPKWPSVRPSALSRKPRCMVEQGSILTQSTLVPKEFQTVVAAMFTSQFLSRVRFRQDLGSQDFEV